MALETESHTTKIRGLLSFSTYAAAVAAAALQMNCAATPPAEVEAATPRSTREITFPALGELRIYNEPGVGARMLEADPTTIWRTLPRVYEALEIPIEVMNEPARELGNTGYHPRRIEGKRLSEFLDCGRGASGPRADSYEITLFIATRLIEEAPAQTIVQTTLEATARPRAVSGNTMHCSSRGNLEMRVAQLIVEALSLY